MLTILQNDQSDYQRIHFPNLVEEIQDFAWEQGTRLDPTQPGGGGVYQNNGCIYAGTLCYHRPLVEDRSFLAADVMAFSRPVIFFLKPGFYKASTGLENAPLVFFSGETDQKTSLMTLGKSFRTRTCFYFRIDSN